MAIIIDGKLCAQSILDELKIKTSKLSMMKKYSGICPEIFIEIKGNTNAKTDIVSNIMRQMLNLLHLPNNNLYV